MGSLAKERSRTGRNGNESVPPEMILKMMFLLFFDDIKSKRELMEVIGSGTSKSRIT